MAKNVQLWTLDSPQIFIAKIVKFWTKLSLLLKNIIIIFFWKKSEKNAQKIKKKLLGVSVQVKICLKKSRSQKDIYFRKSLFEQTPPNSKKWVQSLKNRNSQIFSLDFSNVDIWNIWTPIKWERKFQNPYWSVFILSLQI